MKISGGLREDGVFVGNLYDKYSSKNPFIRYAVSQFSQSLMDLAIRVDPKTIHDVGCGEGYWVFYMSKQGFDVRGTDFAVSAIELAKYNAKNQGINPEIFSVRSIYDLDPAGDRADLIICCEVMEHLERPEDALRALSRAAAGHLIISAPCEPIFRILNIARGKYLSGWGNTPGHLQQWSSKRFIRLVELFFDIIEVKTPIPWTMVLCKARSR